MSPDDHAIDLLVEQRDWLIKAGQRDNVPIGLTYAALIPEDRGDLDQNALERANGASMHDLIEKAAKRAGREPESTIVEGILVVRILDVDGLVTPEGRAAAEAMAALENYPVLDDEKHSEIEQEGFDQDWGQVTGEIEGGYLNTYPRTGGQKQLDVRDDLPEGWEDKIYEAYRTQAHEDRRDDNDYPVVDRVLVGKILEQLGYLNEDEDDDDDDDDDE